jgi:hypothetical protein
MFGLSKPSFKGKSMNTSLRLRALVCTILFAFGASAAAAQAVQPSQKTSQDGWALADRMLIAVGGRDSWAKANYYRILAHHHPPLREGGSHLNIIEMDMNSPRMRFEARGPGLQTLRMVDGDAGWRILDGKPVAMTPEAIAEDNRWWRQHVYRMFHRLAIREPGLEPRNGKDGRLELWVNGQFEMWYNLGVDGTPYRFGTTETGERWTLLGPFVQAVAGGVRYPRWTAWSDGTFRTDSGLFEVYETMPPGFAFAPSGTAQP